MPVRPPSTDELLEIAKQFGMKLTPADAESFRGLMLGSIASYNRLDQLTEPKLPVKYPRSAGYRPNAQEDPYNAWYWRTDIRGAASGILAGPGQDKGRVFFDDDFAKSAFRWQGADSWKPMARGRLPAIPPPGGAEHQQISASGRGTQASSPMPKF